MASQKGLCGMALVSLEISDRASIFYSGCKRDYAVSNK
jgi:hypothetical protein